MKGYTTKTASLFVALAMMMFMATVAAAKSTPNISVRDQKKLDTEILMLNKDATLPHGDQVVMDKIAKEFSVPGSKISSLHESKNLGFGDVAAVYAFADKMPGGINDQNIDKVVSMYQEHQGWAPVAEGLNLNMGKVASKLGTIENDAHTGIKEALIQSGSAAGGGMSNSGTGGMGTGTSGMGGGTGGTGGGY